MGSSNSIDFCEIVVAVGENAAIELRLPWRQIIEFPFEANELVIGQHVQQPRIGIEAVPVPVCTCAPEPGCCGVVMRRF